jgi:predicted NBD/HSP70 family sugar kinase
MYKSGSTSLVRNLNKHHVLNLVRLHKSISARQISDETGLQMSTTLYTLKALEREKYIKNLGLGNTTVLGGKPPSLWGLNKNYGKIIGLELSSTAMKLVVINFTGDILYRNSYKLEHVQSHIVLVHQIIKTVKQVIDSQKIKIKDVLGIGVGITGVVDYSSGSVLYSKGFDYHSITLKSLLEKQLETKFIIDNDSNAAAVGVNWLHDGFNKFQHILYANINLENEGMGLGIIINGQVFRGAHSSAGEVEQLLSNSVINKIIDSALKKYPNDGAIKELQRKNGFIGSEKFIEKALEGNNGSSFLFKEMAKEISKNLISLVNVIDPELVVIGGSICKVKNIIDGIINERLNYGIVAEYTKETKLVFSEYGEYTGAVGAAALVYSDIFSK